jgi:hypothetical protein
MKNYYCDYFLVLKYVFTFPSGFLKFQNMDYFFDKIFKNESRLIFHSLNMLKTYSYISKGVCILGAISGERCILGAYFQV